MKTKKYIGMIDTIKCNTKGGVRGETAVIYFLIFAINLKVILDYGYLSGFVKQFSLAICKSLNQII